MLKVEVHFPIRGGVQLVRMRAFAMGDQPPTQSPLNLKIVVVVQRILDALKRATVNRTTIVIAHRLATVIDADEILVLSRGSIAERGNHWQLLSTPGSLYAKLWERQHRIALEHQAAGAKTGTNSVSGASEPAPAELKTTVLEEMSK